MADSSGAPSSALSPTWTRPKTPLAPDRLAKLANALGVSTPIPSSERPTFFARSSSETPVSPDAFRRSPTPSMASAIAAGYSPSPTNAPTSKFLLHVIPPLHLPHDIGDSDNITAPPSTASGYHTQFRRGTLVPVHSSLQAQLAAIAKEYALPSTAGMILYLVSSGSSSSAAQSPTASSSSHSHSWGMEDQQDEPGPRLSEDIWRHLWIRVLQAEQRDMNSGFLLPSISRSPTPLMLSPTAARSTPFLPSTSPLNASNLRPPTPGSAISTSTPGLQSITNSPSTPSSVSDTRFSNFKTAPPSQSGGGDSINGDVQEPGTPDTSVDVHSQNGHMSNLNLPLPGLNSNSLIPILAKVEFDIDSRKAGWYQPWVRSRKVNKAKRKGARKGSAKDSGDEQEEVEEEGNEKDAGGDDKKKELKDRKKKAKKPAIPLLTGNKEKIDWDAMVPPAPEPEPVVATEAELNGEGYTQLSDSDSDSEFDEDEFAEDSTAKVSASSHGNKGDDDDDDEVADPLQDVFGRDEDTWRDLKAERRATHEIAVDSNPNIVNLALTAQELSASDGDASLMTDDSHFTTPEEEEVRELLDRMSQGGRTPDLHGRDDLDDEDGDVGEDATVTSITSATLTSPQSASQSFSGPSGKRHIPSPLILIPKVTSQAIITDVPSPMPGQGGLPYMDDSRSNSQESLDGRDSGDDDDDETYNYRAKTPSESDKRSGTLFEDLDLGLDPSEDYDDDDPNDRRRSQYVMRAQLDEIERALAQLSPRNNQNDLDEDGANQSMNQSFSSLAPNANMSLGSPSKFTMSPLGPGNADLSPFASPNRGDDPKGPPTVPSTPAAGASWPAIPFSQIKRGSSDSEPQAPSNVNLNSSDPNQPPAPPQLALNGVTTSASRSFAPRSNVNGEASAETLQRRKEMEQEHAMYGRKDQPGAARPSTPPPKVGGATDSPVIPLSPDPFGRFSSSTPDLPIITKPSEKWDTATMGRNSISAEKSGGRARSGTTSRFSVDSIPEGQIPAAPKAASKGTNLMSVKGIKNLWRKSNNNKAEKEKKEAVPPPPTGPSGSGRASPSSLVTLGGLLPTGKRTSGRVSPAGAPPRPDRPSGENFDLPDVPAMHPSSTFGRVSPQPPTPTAPNTRPSSRASHESSRSRPSVELSRPMVPGKRPSVDYANARRPSMDVLMAAQQRRSESSQEPMPPMPPHPNGQNLVVPQRTPSSRGASPTGSSPIVPTQMLPSRGQSAMDRFHFDQESPYPNPLRSMRGAPRTPSPTNQNLPHHQTQPSQSGLSSIAEGQVDRGQQPHKSILKRTGSAQAERELNQDRMSGMNGTNGLRIASNGRKASVASSFSHSSGDTQSSSSPPDGGMARRPSLAPSYASQASSIDSSQFEFVSPKMNSGMAYPAAGYGSGPQDS
ncbi:hypothetical protein BKA70DRAFT_1250221 [Coprinopsis sp. MPI-PUGE-AT-0042]|nr:hypothetical protein BKA70DRAFT_1250221 [Coprinopsis sp. MPI-PUGE-AT-0042]